MVAFVVLLVEEICGVGVDFVLPPPIHGFLFVAEDAIGHLFGFGAGVGPDEEELEYESDCYA